MPFNHDISSLSENPSTSSLSGQPCDDNSTIFQLKITLLDTEPQIWRRIELQSRTTFMQFHIYLQRCMGWKNCHNYRFEAKNPKTGCIDTISYSSTPSENFFQDVKSDCDVFISDYFNRIGDNCFYVYDFTMKWEHLIELEVILDYVDDSDVKYPRCVAGAKACPPENSGGAKGYANILKIYRNPAHKEHAKLTEWLRKFAKGFDPDKFNSSSIFK